MNNIFEDVPANTIPKYSREWMDGLKPGDPVIVLGLESRKLDRITAVESTVLEVHLGFVRVSASGAYYKRDGSSTVTGDFIRPATPELIAVARKIKRRAAAESLKRALQECHDAELAVGVDRNKIHFWESSVTFDYVPDITKLPMESSWL